MKDTDAIEHPHAYVYRVARNVVRELGLKEQTQAILILKKRDGLSRAEIAKQLGISVHTVKKHLLKAVAWCRERGTPDKGRS